MTETIPIAEGHSVTLMQVVGPALFVTLLVIAATMLALFVTGLVAWTHSGRPWIFGWWLRSLAVCTALLGIVSFAAYWTRTYGVLHAAAPDQSLWLSWQLEANGRLAMASLVALIGFVLGTILGPERKQGNRQQSVRGDSGKAADGLTGAPQR